MSYNIGVKKRKVYNMKTIDEIKSYCKVLKAGTSRNRNVRGIYSCHIGTELSDVYGRCSAAKQHAMEWCKQRCKEEGGRNFHISGKNCMQFSVAWMLPNGAIRVETAQNSYYCE